MGLHCNCTEEFRQGQLLVLKSSQIKANVMLHNYLPHCSPQGTKCYICILFSKFKCLKLNYCISLTNWSLSLQVPDDVTLCFWRHREHLFLWLLMVHWTHNTKSVWETERGFLLSAVDTGHMTHIWHQINWTSSGLVQTCPSVRSL